MSLRRKIRSTLTSGSQLFARVEHYAAGTASVRLAGTGSRLSNLPCTDPLQAGQTVVVDYSAEGPPVVRPYILQPEAVLPTPLETVTKQTRPEADAGIVLWSNDDFISARLTRSAPMALSVLPQWEPYDLYGASVIPFTEAVWDTHGMAGGEDGGLRVPIAGRYFVRATVGISPPQYPLEARVSITAPPYFSQYWGDGYAVKRTRNDVSDVTILTVSHIISALEGTTIRCYVTWKTYTGGSYPALSVDGQGAYPIFEAALICPIGSSPKAQPYWWNIS